jgi:CRP/FNR family transcriptional regulator
MPLSAIEALEFIGTSLEGVELAVMASVLVGARRFQVAAGALVFPPGDPEPHVAMVLMGIARSFVTAADGRQLTVRYARRGALIGKRFNEVGAHAPLGVQTITDCTILEFDRELFLRVAAQEISLANALVAELNRRLDDVYATVGDSAFGSMRQRVIRHLLALVDHGAPDGVGRVRISQQQLADSVGSSREVVARVLAELRREGLLRTGPREIELLNVGALVPLLSDWHRSSPY